ncbi:MAG: transaldolase, partial [bacterium]|nr:transaldolase [bacterium]
KLEQEARGDNFLDIFHGVPEIGGRFSALSNFGMVPAAVMGIDAKRFLDSADRMVDACAAGVPAPENPGVHLGVILGTLANHNRDKLTLIASPGLWDLGAWLEQLIAESTGKEGKAIIPVDREPLGEPELYGTDRMFAYIRLTSAPDAAQDAGIEAIEKAGQPVIRIDIADIYDLGQEFFRWEVATAVAGSVMGVNPFNQPDVQ